MYAAEVILVRTSALFLSPFPSFLPPSLTIDLSACSPEKMQGAARVAGTAVATKITTAQWNVTYVFLDGMRPKFPRKDVEDLLAHPTAFGECCEREVIGVDLPQTCNTQKKEK